jgi:hypothetical protein
LPAIFTLQPPARRIEIGNAIRDSISNRHCERSEAISGL